MTRNVALANATGKDLSEAMLFLVGKDKECDRLALVFVGLWPPVVELRPLVVTRVGTRGAGTTKGFYNEWENTVQTLTLK